MKKLTILLTILFFIGLTFNMEAQYLTEDFESGTFPPVGWTPVQLGDPAGFEASTTFSHSPSTAAYHDYFIANCDDYLVSPVIDLSGATAPYMEFWSYVNFSTYADLHEVMITTDMISYTVLWSVITTEDTWEYVNIDLSAYAGQSSVYIAFHYTGNDAAEWYFDDIIIQEPPTCPAPSALTATNILSTSADLGWIIGGAELQWNVELGLPGFTPGTGANLTGVTGTTDNPWNVTGGSPSTTYEFYVQADCGGDLSVWAGPFSFTTLCAAITAFPYSENFDGAWDCWEVVDNDIDGYTWIQDDSYITPHSGLWTAHGMGNNDDYLISPQFTLGSGMEVKWWDIVESATYNNTYDVLLSTTTNDIASFTINLGTYDCTNEIWMEHTIDLSAYTGDVYIAFHQTYSAATYYGFGIDDFLLRDIPTCPAPSALTATNILSTSADLGWIIGGAELQWNVELGLPGFIPGTGAELTGVTGTTDNPWNITGGSPNTTYEFYVQADCGGDLSVWAGPYLFTTACSVYTPDYLENFATFLPGCWDDNVGPVTGPTGTSGSSEWYDNGFANIGITGSANINLYTTGAEDWLLSPHFDLSSGGYEVNVDIAVTAYASTSPSAMGSDDEVQLLYTENGTTWNNITTWNVGNTPSNTGDNLTFDISTITGSDVQFAFWAYEGTVNDPEDYDFFVDNFAVRTPPTCPAPSALTATNILSTSADLGWIIGGAELQWNVELGLPGFIPGTGAELTGVTGTTDNPWNVTGGSPNTTYEFYVQADCGGSTSTWAGPYTFTTLCGAITSLPWTEDFELVTIPDFPNCWLKENGGWITTNNSNSTYDADAHSGTQFLRNNYSAIDEFIWSPGFDLISGTSYDFSFWWAGDNYNGWTGDVFYNIVQNSVGATQIGSSFVIPATTTTTTYQNVIKTFVPSASGVYYFAIRVNATSNPWYLSFDDFEMKLSPTCPQPTDLSAVNITDVSADLGWIEGGSATTWNVELGLPGFTPGTGAELTGVTGTTDNPWTASGGSPETDYEFYVQADCGGTDLSIWSGPYSFTTLMTPLTNPTPCAAGGLIIDELHIPINVTGITGTQLGTDILLNEVHFIAQHVYDSDMDISLESPNGVIVDLSIGNGSSDNDYGVPGGICDQYTNFNMFGIDGDISSGTAPFVGSFIPDGDFSDFNDGSDPNGIWTIHIIDTWPSSDNGVFEFTELTFRPISSETDIIAYSFPEATGPATINATNHTVNIEVGFGTSLTALVASYTLSIGATAEISATPQVSGVTSNDFSGSVTYTITAEDGTTTQDWVVTVTVASALLTETDILTYSFPEETGAAVIDPIGHTVNIEVDWEADITNLTADFTLSYGATASISAVPQTSGVTVNDFTNPVTYTITAEDGTTTQDWVVSVTIQPAPQGALCSNPIPLTLPVVSETGNTAGFGDNYDDGMACSSYYMTGDDIVYEFTVTQPGLLSGGMTSTETWIGMFILDGCPDAGANCIVTATSIGSSVSFSDEYLDAGTYYVVISSYPSPQSIDFDFNLYYNPLAPEVLWDATTFVESLANDGSIPTIVNLTLNDETFATTGVLTTTEYSVANVPAGLSVEINATTTTDAIVTLTGNAISHTNADDISNMEITFLDAAFTGGVASNVAGYSQTALVVDFIDPVEIVINEVDADQTVTDSEEFIELFDGGVGNSSLDGYALVFYNGANDLVYDAYDLDGYSTDANGYFVIGSSLVANVDYDLGPVTDLIQNGADAVALYIDDASSFIINTTAVTTNNLLDALVYDTNDPDDAGLLVLLNPGQPQINEGGQGISTLHSCSRLPNGSGGLRNTDTYSPAKPTPGEINRAIPVLTWDATTFLEDFANDGSIQTVVNISLSDETFVITSGVMTETTHYTVANVPAGLTVLITATDANNATIELIGNATSHLNADDIANMEITFTNAAFTANQAALVTNYSQTALAVDFFDVTPAFLTWDATTFTEDVANDGSISTVINLNLTFDTFVITTGAMTEATHYNVANVPAGLSVLITATDANNATVELTGNATNHADIDDISNMEITFLNAAFTGNDASNVTVASQTALVVDYIDPYIVDVAIIDPASGNYQMCGLPSTTPIQIEIQNLGDMAIVAGTTIDITAIIENNPMVTETMTLPDLNPNDTWTYTFTQLFDLSLIQVYNWKFYLHKYLSDIDATNDTTEGTMEHIELTVNIDNGDTVTVAALPYTLIESDVFDEYEWTNEIGTVLGTTSTVNVGAYGWYYLYVENYSTNCSAIDSILILEPVIVDLAVTMPGAINYLCDLTASEQVPVCITNYGSAAIIAGETIDVTLEFPIGTVYDVGTITLTSDLAVLDDICIYFGNTVDMSAIDIYDFGIYFTYLTDSDHNNDTVWGFVNHYETVVDLSGVNDTITVGAYPTTLDAGVCSNPGGFTCTYLWDDSSTNQTLDVSLDGWYYVTVTDDNGCEGDDSVYVVLNIGINDVENIFSVDVYPNPNNGFFTLAISSTNGTENTVQLIDLQGQVIETRKLSGNTIIETFDMTDIAKGIYYIKVSSDNGIKIEKVAVH